MGVGLTNREIEKVVNDYIGVAEGHFGDFSYSTHADFHPALRDLDVDLSLYGKTREQFVDLLASQPPEDQAKILQGLIELCPSEADNPPRKRAKTASEMLTWVQRLESGSQVVALVPEATRAVVVRALADAEQLLRTAGAPSSVDRVHTALHGHLLALCEAAGIETQPNASMAAIFKALRRSHPNLAAVGPQQQDIEKVLNATSAIFDALGPVRNRASVAHPNSHLLGEDEAMLVINVGNSLFNYLDAKLR
jgi:Abortive infection C-terminus